jgi:hypothetical protein
MEIVFIVATVALFAISALVLMDMTGSTGVEFVNPVFLYKRFKVNIFGLIIMTLVFNVFTLPCAVIYWLYKLYTIGRK